MILGERSAEFVSFDFFYIFLFLVNLELLRVLSIFCVEGSDRRGIK